MYKTTNEKYEAVLKLIDDAHVCMNHAELCLEDNVLTGVQSNLEAAKRRLDEAQRLLDEARGEWRQDLQSDSDLDDESEWS